MSVYKGTSLLAGVSTNTISNSNYLLDWKWSDHIINSMEWLRADTYSWQSGSVYTAVYNHLVADNSSGTSQTETVGSYTISYKLATDGHKITTDESTVANIYNETGEAWYYVLDTTNQRFKLPRSSHGGVVEKYTSGTNWYRVYADGWCEQGGVSPSGADQSTVTVSLLKAFSNTNYSVTAIQRDGPSGNYTNGIRIVNYTISSFQINYRTGGNTTAYWQACGYVSSVPENSQYKYLYFYVGEYSQSATEQTAGLNSELFNGKIDLDLSNMNPSQSAGQTIVGWGCPDYTSGVAIDTTYTAPQNGFIWLWMRANDAYKIAKINNIEVYQYNHSSGYSTSDNIWIPISAGDVYEGDIQHRVFFPCKGV